MCERRLGLRPRYPTIPTHKDVHIAGSAKTFRLCRKPTPLHNIQTRTVPAIVHLPKFSSSPPSFALTGIAPVIPKTFGRRTDLPVGLNRSTADRQAKHCSIF